jgi:hypothetical protein
MGKCPMLGKVGAKVLDEGEEALPALPRITGIPSN